MKKDLTGKKIIGQVIFHLSFVIWRSARPTKGIIQTIGFWLSRGATYDNENGK
jgi:hypothetical protein